MENTAKHKQDTRNERGRKNTLQAISRNNGHQYGCHCSRRAGYLIKPARKRTDHQAGNNGRNQPGRRRRTAAYTEGQRQRKRHRRNRQPGHEILYKIGPAVVLKLFF